MLDDDPLSLTCFTSSRTVLERASENWKVHAQTFTKVWTEEDQEGHAHFRYRAGIKTFIWEDDGGFTLFEEKKVEGSIPRDWV